MSLSSRLQGLSVFPISCAHPRRYKKSARCLATGRIRAVPPELASLPGTPSLCLNAATRRGLRLSPSSRGSGVTFAHRPHGLAPSVRSLLTAAVLLFPSLPFRFVLLFHFTTCFLFCQGLFPSPLLPPIGRLSAFSSVCRTVFCRFAASAWHFPSFRSGPLFPFPAESDCIPITLVL